MPAIRSSRLVLAVCLASAAGHAQQTVEVASVTARALERTIELPGEFHPYQSVALHARVSGYVERVTVDRGSNVRQGELLVELSAPEVQARIAEAQSRVQLAQAETAQAEAQLAAAESTHEKLQKAAETPGAIAGNEVIQAGKQVEAAQALVNARRQSSRAAEAALEALRDMAGYLQVTAPFDGVITERLVHPGTLVKPDAEPALLVLQQISRLRLVVAVPEQNVGHIVHGARVPFRVPAFPERPYTGTVARVAHALDEKTRTMAVELDVVNSDQSLSPGMYPTVSWPVRSARARLLVPATAVVTTTERVFVIRVRNGQAEWVDVRKGVPAGDQIEVLGALAPGDLVVRRGTDEIRPGAAVPVRGR